MEPAHLSAAMEKVCHYKIQIYRSYVNRKLAVSRRGVSSALDQEHTRRNQGEVGIESNTSTLDLNRRAAASRLSRLLRYVCRVSAGPGGGVVFAGTPGHRTPHTLVGHWGHGGGECLSVSLLFWLCT